MPDFEERELVERAKEDPDAFGALYDRYFPQIYRFAYSRVRDQSLAEDVTSEVFFKALRNIKRYTYSGHPFSSWLHQITPNAVPAGRAAPGSELPHLPAHQADDTSPSHPLAADGPARLPLQPAPEGAGAGDGRGGGRLPGRARHPDLSPQPISDLGDGRGRPVSPPEQDERGNRRADRDPVHRSDRQERDRRHGGHRTGHLGDEAVGGPEPGDHPRSPARPKHDLHGQPEATGGPAHP